MPNGGTLVVDPGGIADPPTIDGGGSEIVSSGGTTVSTVISGFSGPGAVVRIGKAFANLPGEVTHIGRAEHRKHQIGSVADAPYPKGHAEVVAVVREVDACRYVDKATDADRAVHGKARDRFGCQMGLRLEKIVREHERLIQIPQEISDGIAVGRGRICGWAQDAAHPEAPVCLDILVGGELIGQVAANRYRADLAVAGLGSGRHGFEFLPPPGLAFTPRSIGVRRSLDGASLACLRRSTGWFTEGFDTADLKEAKGLLDKLS
jgi:autotransporter passenger strand-loop-strand repeat protein